MLALKEKGTSGAQGSGPIWSNIDAEKAKIAAMYGPQKANRLSAIANAEDAMNLKNIIEMHPNIQKPGMIEQGIQLARAPVSFAALAHMLVAPSAATIGAGMVGVGEVAKRLVLTVEERRIASEVNRLLSSQNPGTVLRLSKMAEKNPAVNTLMEKYNTLMAEMLTANVQLRPSTERTMERQERKSGGRVSDKLVAMVDRSKKNINNSTQSLLQTPDSHVAHALEIANRNLEG
jgi:hypothetical protein